MWAVAGVLAIVIIIAWLEVPKLLKNQLTKELWAFATLLLFGTVISIAQTLHVDLPNPLDWLTFIYKPVSDAVRHLLG